ncbi:biotin--[acetyl-CoA-carboxylase] ligase [Intrasporangium sp. YIM S08009]|uniref:biotin--[acetyl-CoA-carboxylase] ligase n=1 Tax=Intrasporangium zincisolvens TaxID=3080018 RepID=UPI002B052529|nr:biotin--[acetyl-CoA-carboxylase] ligase [Intrasporangium sp. YIM S08009]
MRNSLEPEIVGAALVTSGQPWRGVEFHPAIGSTNSRLRELLTGAAEGIGPDASRLASADGALWWVVLTDHQTGGRGRLGRVWEVPDRASVAVSAAVPVTDTTDASDASGLGWLPLLAGLALARAITATTARAGHALSPRLKWPNDVLLPEDGDRKVSGILCELVDVPGPTPRRAVVVGTGVNVDQDRDELPVDTATSVALTGVRVRREDVVVAYLHELAALVGPGVGARLGADGAREAYREACSTLGQVVRVHLPVGEAVEGTAVAVDDTGALVVDTPSGRRTFAAGDVVHVRRR